MNKNSNTYIIIYASVMIIIVAVVLSVASASLRSRQQANVMVEKQSAILGAVGKGADAAKASDKRSFIENEYAKYIIDSYAVNGNGDRIESVEAFELLDKLKEEYSLPQSERALPVFEARLDDGRKLYVLAVYGSGLWGPIWGYVALEDDWNTVYGAVFDHEGETPGLGAEITSEKFYGQFPGKQIFDANGFRSIAVLKGAGASAGNINAVDAVSGGTITSRGVQAMLHDCLTAYLPFIEKQRTATLQPAAPEVVDEVTDVENIAITEEIVDYE